MVARRLADIIGREHPDVIHAHNWIVNSVFVAQRGAGQVPVVLTVHDYSVVCATKRYMYLDAQECSGPAVRRCLRCAPVHYRGATGAATYLGNVAAGPMRRRNLARILAVSSAVAERNRLAESGIPYEVVPNFIPDALTELPPLPPCSPPQGFASGGYLLYVGDLSPDKGVDVLLRAYSALPPRRPPLLLLGRRTPATPVALPVGAEIRNSVPHERVMAAFAHAAVVVAPSTWPDPCPTVVLEAMAAGRAVVTTRTGGMVDMIRDGVDGVLLPPGDAHALAAAMRALISDPRNAAALGSAAHTRVADFTASRVVPRIERIYHDVAHIPAVRRAVVAGAASPDGRGSSCRQ
jgi:glycosyltransferase involved in cell wall biosynthesis